MKNAWFLSCNIKTPFGIEEVQTPIRFENGHPQILQAAQTILRQHNLPFSEAFVAKVLGENRGWGAFEEREFFFWKTKERKFATGSMGDRRAA